MARHDGDGSQAIWVKFKDGTEVLFNVEQGEKGPQATTVQPLSALSHA